MHKCINKSPRLNPIWHTVCIFTFILFLLSGPIVCLAEQVTIFYQNDLHGWFFPSTQTGGLWKVKEFLKEELKGPAIPFYVVAGDIFTGPDIPLEKKGQMELEIWKYFQNELDSMGYKDRHVLSLGNHEFDYGFDMRLKELDPIIANILDGLGKPVFKPYKIIKAKDVSLGFLGIMLNSYEKANEAIQNKGFKISDPLETIMKYEDQICQADIGIVVIHENISRIKEVANALSEKSCIKLFVTGHTHVETKDPIVVNGRYIVQAGSMNQNLGRIVLDVGKRQAKLIQNQLLPLALDRFEFELIKMKELIDERNGKTLGVVNDSLLKPRSRVPQDSSLGNLITDAIRWKAKTDIAILNNDSIRQELHIRYGPLPLREGDVKGFLPFQNKIVKGLVKGMDILSFLEAEAEDFKNQVSGIIYEVDLNRPVGKRVIKAMINGREIQKERLYSIAINSYMAKPKNISELLHGLRIEEMEELKGIYVSDALREYVGTLGQINYFREGDGRIKTRR